MRLINRHPAIVLRAALIALPFVLLFVAYALGSQARLAENPSDKLMPSPAKVADTAIRLLTEPDKRSERVLFWYDTWASLVRLTLGDRVLVFDKPRWDPTDPDVIGATITYDFDARNGGIPYQTIKEETHVLHPA